MTRRVEAAVVLAGGTAVEIGRLSTEDAGALRRFHDRLSPDTVQRRFLGWHGALSDAEVAYFTGVDQHDRVALAARIGGELVGVARYDVLAGGREAEAAFVVEDRWQGHGIGTALCDHLAAVARAGGVRWFVADTLAGNARMLHVFATAGAVDVESCRYGCLHVRIDLMPEAGLSTG